MLLNCGVGEDSWESLGLQGDQTSPSSRRSVLNIHWKDWCWNSSTLATWCEELIHWKRPWCWERLKAGGEGDDRGWDGWMASLALWTPTRWVWTSSGSWWWMGSLVCCSPWSCKRVRHGWATELNWKKDNTKECSNYCTIALISHASKIMLKILQARLQLYMYWELPDVQAGLEKAEEPVIKLPTFTESWRKQGNSRKTSTFASWTSKAFDCVNHNKLWKILKELGTPDNLICLLRKLYGSQEATVRTVHETTDLFKIEKGIQQGCILSPYLFNLYAENIMWNARLYESQGGIKIAGRNINNLRYADDTTLMAESKEELKSLSWWELKRRVKTLAWNSTFKN